MSGETSKYGILRIWVLRIDSSPPRALIPTPSCLFMPTKCPCTEIPSQNPNLHQRSRLVNAISREIIIRLT